VLDSSATKREAKAYLQRFTPPNSKPSISKEASENPETSASLHGVNLGTFYGGVRAVQDSPRFIQHPEMGAVDPAMIAPLHIALVKIRAPQIISDETLDGVGRTLSQLAKLGLTSTVVIDCTDPSVDLESCDWKALLSEQSDRVVAAIDAHSGLGARKLDNIIGFSDSEDAVSPSAAYIRGATHVVYRKLLMTPLRRGIIPVIPAIGYTDNSHQIIPLNADDVVLALTREFSGFQAPPLPDEDPNIVAQLLKALRNEVSLDRLIILDPLGGIPSSDRVNGYHVFLNLEQEFGKVKADLLSPLQNEPISSMGGSPNQTHISDIPHDGLFSQFVETEFGLTSHTLSQAQALLSRPTAPSANNMIHLQNLELVQRVLSILAPSSSALLTTPEEASNSGKQPNAPFQVTEVGTRRKRNPLIHNLLTDKPVFSSSLPVGRLGRSAMTGGQELAAPANPITPTTFAKRGMSITIFPDPRIHPWQPPGPGRPGLNLTDSQIDLPRLVYLIDDSFDRKLDVQSYLKRVQNRVAGVIIAGEYEGGALLTWELPPGIVDDGSEEVRSRMVPYLDKFAVLKRSQGAGGVADIVFKSMVRDCFPNGVCWRSRRNNPVNKWYFERSRGTWKIHDTNWTMFWTTPDLNADTQTFSDYESVCRSILPTWADNKKVID
jgi:amino-acid N-acetyltransferase